MAQRKPLTLRVQQAVMESCMPMDLRHLVHVLAVCANAVTGAGWVGQETIAKHMGCSLRHVRDLMADLAKAESAPVRIERRPRFRDDGRGRTSDEWRLLLAEASDQPAQGAAYSPEQPAQHAGKSVRLTGTPRRTNRHATTDQPAQRAGDLRSDRRSDRRSSCASTSEAPSFRLSSPSPEVAKPAPPKAPRKAKQADSEQSAKHRRVVAFYFDAFEKKRGSRPVGFDGADGRAVSRLLEKSGGDAERACTVIANALGSWKGDTVTIRQIASDPSQFASAATHKRLNGRTPTQPNYGVSVNAEIVEG